MNYSKARYYEDYLPLLTEIFARHDEKLADFTISTTKRIARELGIVKTEFRRSSEFSPSGHKTDRLLDILSHFETDSYLTGPSARDYLDHAKFSERGIKIEYMRYDYPVYPQLHGEFEGKVTILDLLLNAGPEAPRLIWK